MGGRGRGALGRERQGAVRAAVPTWAALAMRGARVWLPMSENTPEGAGSTEPEYSAAARTTKVAIWARVTERPGENEEGPVPAMTPTAARRLIALSCTEP